MDGARKDEPETRRSLSPSQQLKDLISDDDEMEVDDQDGNISSRGSFPRDTTTQSGSEDPQKRKGTTSPGTSPEEDMKAEPLPTVEGSPGRHDAPKTESGDEETDNLVPASSQHRAESPESDQSMRDIKVEEESIPSKEKTPLKPRKLFGSDSDAGMYPPSSGSGTPMDEDLVKFEPGRPATPPEREFGLENLGLEHSSDEDEKNFERLTKKNGIDACRPDQWKKHSMFVSMVVLPQEPDQRPGKMFYMLPSINFLEHDYSQAMAAEPKAVYYRPPMKGSAGPEGLDLPRQRPADDPTDTSDWSLCDLLPRGFKPQRAINVSQWAFLELSQFLRPRDIITCESTDDYRTQWYCSEDWNHPSYRWPGPETAYCVQCWKPSLRPYTPPLNKTGRPHEPVFGQEHPIDIEKFNNYLAPRMTEGERAYLTRAMEKGTDIMLTRNHECREAALFHLFCEQLRRNGGLPVELGGEPVPVPLDRFPLFGPDGPFWGFKVFGPLHDIIRDHDRKWREKKTRKVWHPNPEERQVLARQAARAALLEMIS